MTALPAATDFTGSSITEAQFKSAITDLRSFLAGLLGTDGTVATALAALDTMFAAGVTAKTGAYTVATTDRGRLISCTGTWTLTLPAAATAGGGFAFALRNSGTGAITLDGAASETIDGKTTITLAAGASAVIVCTGTAWLSVGLTATIPDASDAVKGVVELATTAEASTGTDTDRAVTCAGLTAAINARAVKLDHGYNAVGSLCFCYNNSAGGTKNPGNTGAGSDLYPGYTSSEGAGYNTSYPLSGTWRCLGYGYTQKYTLWQRIA